MSVNKQVKIPHIIWYIAPILFVIAAVVLLFASGSVGKAEGTAATGPQIGAMALVYVAVFAVMPLTAIWLWKYSKGVEAVTHEKMNFAIAMLVLLAVPDGIDILIVQDAFNKIAQAPAFAGPTAPSLPKQ